MSKFRVKAPIGGHGQKIWMPNEIVNHESDFRISVDTLIGDGFIERIEDEDAAAEKANEEKNAQLNIPVGGEPGDQKPEETKKEEVENKTEAPADVDDTTTIEIKKELDYEGIKYPENATKAELFELYKKGK